MTALGAGVALVGYWLAYFGWESIRGPGVGLFDLIIPGRLDAAQATAQGAASQGGGTPVASSGGGKAPVPAGSVPPPRSTGPGSVNAGPY